MRGRRVDVSRVAVAAMFVACGCRSHSSSDKPAPTSRAGVPPSAEAITFDVERIPSVTVPYVANASIVIDGSFDDALWTKTRAIGPFVDVGSGKPRDDLSLSGYVRLAYDDAFFYVGFTVLDDDIRGGFPRDAIDPHLWERDTTEIMIDPDGDGDNKDYFEIQINPQNLVFDSRFDDYNAPRASPSGPFGHQEWWANVESRVAIQGTMDDASDQDVGYSVEAKIPWKVFATAAKPERTAPTGETWRMNFYAMQDNSGVAWSPILGKGNFHKASRFGRVTFGPR
jgi:hypothetical protein